LVEKEFKDPKSVIVSVKLAGEKEAENPETPPTPELFFTPAEETETAPVAAVETTEISEETEESRPLVRRRRRSTSNEVSQEISQEASPEVTFTPEPITPETPIFLSEVISLETQESPEVTEEPSEAETSVVRRRRRRSSAAADES
jgi:ribonuclease E